MLLSHLQLLDSALPVGAFSHSFGLETLVQNGAVSSPEELREYSRAMLHGSWSSCDAMAIRGAFLWLPQNRHADLWRLDARLHASRMARESRDGAQKMGRRALQLFAAMHPQLPFAPLQTAVARGECAGLFPTVYGYATFHLGATQDDAAHGFLYSCLAAVWSNAVKLMPLGQSAAQTLLASLLLEIEVAWNAVKARDPNDFSSAVPLFEIAAMNHETLYSRLFMS